MTTRVADGTRTARVNRTGEGRPLGVVLFLTSGELHDLGINPGAADHVAYAVADGELQLTLPDTGVSSE